MSNERTTAPVSHKIGVATATIVGMNAMIGSGIFAIPGVLAADAGPAGIITTIAVACAAWFMASSIARLAYLYPEEGSFYTYARQWGGHTMGLLSSGAYLIGLLIAMGLLSKMAGVYLQHYFPTTSINTLGLATLIILVVLNLAGATLSEWGQRILIACTVFPLIATIVMCFTRINVNNLYPFAPSGFSGAALASKDVLFSFFGFEAAASLFAIVKDPEKNVPRALTYSLALVSILYILFAAAIILSTPLNLLPGGFGALTHALQSVFPNNPWLIEAIHVSILSAIVGTVHSMIWSSSNLLVALVKQFNRAITERSAVILVGTCICFTFMTIDRPSLFFTLTALFIVFAYATSMITLLTLPSEWRSKQNIKTLIGLLTAGIIFSFAGVDLIHEIKKLFM